VTAIRRPSSAEGRSVGSSSGGAVLGALGGIEDVSEDGAGEVVDVGIDCEEGGGGLGESAKCRAWNRILHCRQVDGRSEGRLDIRSDCLGVKDAIESKKSLGTNRASGCMAGVPSSSRCRAGKGMSKC